MITLCTIVHRAADWNAPRVERNLRDAFTAARMLESWEVLVVDTSPEPVEVVRQLVESEGGTYLTSAGWNIGYGGGINLAAQNAHGDRLVYFSAKRGRMLRAKWITELVAPLADETVGMTGTILPCWLAVLAENTVGMEEIHVQGGAFAARTEVLRQFPYSPRFPQVYSDVWISWRLRKAGLRLVNVPTVRSIPIGTVPDPERYSYIVDYSVPLAVAANAPLATGWPSVETLMERIGQAGSANTERYGGSWSGGYRLRQQPYELARCLDVLNGLGPRVACLELGVVSGGVVRLLAEHLELRQVFLVGGGSQSYRAKLMAPLVQCEIDGWQGTLLECRSALAERAWQYDLAVLPAYPSVGELLTTITDHLADGAVVLLRDSESNEESRSLFLRVSQGEIPRFRTLFNFVAPPQNRGLAGLVYRREPVPPSSVVHGFWHIATMNYWQEVVVEQYRKLEKSGLLDACQGITVGVLGDVPAAESLLAELDRSHKVQVGFRHADLGRQEFVTTRMAQEWSYARDGRVFYIHTKGVSRAHPGWKSRLGAWRQYMEHFVIEHWHWLHDALADHDCCGVHLQDTPHKHFSGNFWWANANYLRRLPPVNTLDLTNRVEAETWIGRPRTGAMNALSFHQLNGYDNLYWRDLRAEEYRVD